MKIALDKMSFYDQGNGAKEKCQDLSNICFLVVYCLFFNQDWLKEFFNRQLF